MTANLKLTARNGKYKKKHTNKNNAELHLGWSMATTVPFFMFYFCMDDCLKLLVIDALFSFLFSCCICKTTCLLSAIIRTTNQAKPDCKAVRIYQCTLIGI